jgi:protein phosphatase
MTRLTGAAHSDIGQVRAVNQDSAVAEPGMGLFVVADGMGGHLGGEVASALAVETLLSAIRAAGPSAGPGIDSTESLVDAVLGANERVFDEGRSNAELQGMGTTLCALALVGSGPDARLAVVNVGDSRIYLLRDGELEQLTEDHSLVQELVRQGQLTPEEAASHPMRNVVTRVIGVEGDVEVDWWERPADPGDRYLLCSDGLFNEVTESRIAATLRALADPGEAARTLVALANDGGGRDNITCVVVDVHDGDGLAGPVDQTAADPAAVATRAGAVTLISTPAPAPAPAPEVGITGALPALGPGPTAAVALAAELDPVPVPVPVAAAPARPPLVTGRVVAFVLLVGAVLAVAVVAVRVLGGGDATAPARPATTALVATSAVPATTAPGASAPVTGRPTPGTATSAPVTSGPPVTASPASPAASPTPPAAATPSNSSAPST